VEVTKSAVLQQGQLLHSLLRGDCIKRAEGISNSG